MTRPARDSAHEPQSRVAINVLSLVAGASWGAVAGGFLFGFLATVAGAPTGTEAGEIIPQFGWNRFTAFVIGLPVGCAVGTVVAWRAAHRWPWLVGVPLALVGALAIVSSFA